MDEEAKFEFLGRQQLTFEKMETNNHKQAKYKEENFHCPHCGALAHQHYWYLLQRPIFDSHDVRNSSQNILGQEKNENVAYCQYCRQYALWKPKEMVFLKILTTPLPHQDMPVSVKEIYEEARKSSNDSPRAATLLRVALEKLTEELGAQKGSLNARIGNLQKKDLPPKIIKVLDVIRINANEGGSHSGAIDLTGQDGAEIVDTLFLLVNIIIEITISKPKDTKE